MRRTLTLITLIILSLAIWALVWFPRPTSVRFGYQPFGSNLPFFVAVENGFFEKRGVSIKPVEIVSANDAANSVVRDDIAGNATVPLNVMLNIEAISPGEMKIFLVKAVHSEGRWSDYLLVPADSTISSIRDLANKRVGGYPGSAQQALLHVILEQFVPPDQVELVELPPSVQLQALQTGQVDALLTYDERAILALDKGIAKVLVRNPLGKYVLDPLYGFPYVMSTDFINSNPDEARAIRDAFYEAVDFIQRNEGAARKIMAKWTGVSPQVANEVRLWAQVKVEDIDREALQRLADIFYEQGVVQQRIDTRDFYYSAINGN